MDSKQARITYLENEPPWVRSIRQKSLGNDAGLALDESSSGGEGDRITPLRQFVASLGLDIERIDGAWERLDRRDELIWGQVAATSSWHGLRASYWNDGYILDVPEGLSLEWPLQLDFLVGPRSRLYVRVAEGASLDLVVGCAKPAPKYDRSDLREIIVRASPGSQIQVFHLDHRDGLGPGRYDGFSFWADGASVEIFAAFLGDVAPKSPPYLNVRHSDLEINEIHDKSDPKRCYEIGEQSSRIGHHLLKSDTEEAAEIVSRFPEEFRVELLKYCRGCFDGLSD